MPDQPYQSQNYLFKSKGITARYADDATPPGTYATLASCEEIEENGIASRLGTAIINRTGAAIYPLPGPVHSLEKLGSLNGLRYRYAGVGTGLYRRAGLGQGPYTQIASSLSGDPWISSIYRPDISSQPYLFLADRNGMLKDNGTLAAPQQMGIFQPQYPIVAAAQAPYQVILDDYTGAAYSYTGTSGGVAVVNVSTTLLTAVPTLGINHVAVSDPTQIGQFQVLTVGSGSGAETLLVLEVLPTGFVAKFTKTHLVGEAVGNFCLSVYVPASTTTTISGDFAGTPIASWPVLLEQADYIGLYLYVSDPAQINKIILKFDCGDGSFNTDYFYKVIGQGPMQALLDGNTDSSTSAADVVMAQTLGLFSNTASGISQLTTGLNQWTPLLIQLSDFAGAGHADFNDPVFNWRAVRGYQVEIITNSTTSVTTRLAGLNLFGGSGPDSFAGVEYDWLVTHYNAIDGTESNPCMVMTQINAHSQTNRVTPRRQPVQLQFTNPTLDPQSTHFRVYRRGGTLSDNYRRVDQIPAVAGTSYYLDISSDSDIQGADIISFRNDVPVTSSLPIPVNTALSVAVGMAAVNDVHPASMANISIHQQISIGYVTDKTFETMIVLAVFPDHFTAYCQNAHMVGEEISATAKYGQPVTLIAQAYGQMWFAGDPNNPSYLYWSAKSNPQAVSSAAYVEVSTPDDPITAIASYKGNLFVSTVKKWWSVAPGSNDTQSPTVYPTAADHGCVAPMGWTLKGNVIWYQAIDGIRLFSGGASTYESQEIEFIFQGLGTTPVPFADQLQLSKTRMAFWNNMVMMSYIGTDGFRHRLIMHDGYSRWRNDDVDCQSMILEVDTNTILFGDSNGLIRQDRIGTYDEGSVGNSLVASPINFILQTTPNDQGQPDLQKNFNEMTLDINTQGQPVRVQILLNGGQSSLDLGTVSTATRQRVNLVINEGDGVQAYKAALLLTGSAILRVYMYQAEIRSVSLAKTRKSIDTYWLRLGTDESKQCKQAYIEYNAGAAIQFLVYYDNHASPGFSFVLPALGGARTAFRQRLPAIKFRTIRLVGTSNQDFQIWTESKLEYKPVCQGKGYQVAALMP